MALDCAVQPAGTGGAGGAVHHGEMIVGIMNILMRRLQLPFVGG